MNHFLASVVAGLNAAIAILIIVLLAAVGGIMASQQHLEILIGVIVGGVVGVGVASLVCGVLALLIDIRNRLRELVEINRAATSGPKHSGLS